VAARTTTPPPFEDPNPRPSPGFYRFFPSGAPQNRSYGFFYPKGFPGRLVWEFLLRFFFKKPPRGGNPKRKMSTSFFAGSGLAPVWPQFSPWPRMTVYVGEPACCGGGPPNVFCFLTWGLAGGWDWKGFRILGFLGVPRVFSLPEGAGWEPRKPFHPCFSHHFFLLQVFWDRKALFLWLSQALLVLLLGVGAGFTAPFRGPLLTPPPNSFFFLDPKGGCRRFEGGGGGGRPFSTQLRFLFFRLFFFSHLKSSDVGVGGSRGCLGCKFFFLILAHSPPGGEAFPPRGEELCPLFRKFGGGLSIP